jgi:ABC-2 type transport system permease protein
VTQATAGTTLFSRTLGQFDEGAWTQLLLFLFLTALTGAVALIETRRLGVARRMLAIPTTATTVIAGEATSRVLIACLQAAVIIFGYALLFGVNWGQPAGVAAPASCRERLGVLAAYAVVLLALAAWRLRRVLSG